MRATKTGGSIRNGVLMMQAQNNGKSASSQTSFNLLAQANWESPVRRPHSTVGTSIIFKVI